MRAVDAATCTVLYHAQATIVETPVILCLYARVIKSAKQSEFNLDLMF